MTRKPPFKRTKAAPVEMREWPDGINPFLVADVEHNGAARAAAIVETRLARAAELDAWQAGAGDTYLAAFSLHR